MTLTFNIPQETVDLICSKFGYTKTIKIPTGKFINEEELMLEKPLSQEDFIYNYYSSLIDSHAVEYKQTIARTTLLEQVKTVTLDSKQESRLSVLTKEEIDKEVEIASSLVLSTI